MKLISIVKTTTVLLLIIAVTIYISVSVINKTYYYKEDHKPTTSTTNSFYTTPNALHDYFETIFSYMILSLPDIARLKKICLFVALNNIDKIEFYLYNNEADTLWFTIDNIRSIGDTDGAMFVINPEPIQALQSTSYFSISKVRYFSTDIRYPSSFNNFVIMFYDTDDFPTTPDIKKLKSLCYILYDSTEYMDINKVISDNSNSIFSISNYFDSIKTLQ